MRIEVYPTTKIDAVDREQRLNVLPVAHQHRSIAEVEPDAVERAVTVVVDIAGVVDDHVK